MSFRRVIMLSLALCALAPLSGCIGSFALTKMVFDWNRGLGPWYVQEIVFLVFILLPVYNITVLVDAVILNLVEALTGENPISEREAAVRQVAVAEDSHLRMFREGDTLYTELAVKGAPVTVRRFVLQRNGVEVRDGDGLLLATASMDRDGGITVLDPGGRAFAEYTPAEVDRAIEAYQTGGARALALAVQDARAAAVADVIE